MERQKQADSLRWLLQDPVLHGTRLDYPGWRRGFSLSFCPQAAGVTSLGEVVELVAALFQDSAGRPHFDLWRVGTGVEVPVQTSSDKEAVEDHSWSGGCKLFYLCHQCRRGGQMSLLHRKGDCFFTVFKGVCFFLWRVFIVYTDVFTRRVFI